METKQKAIKGGVWITTSTIISVIFQFLQIAFLARLLEPKAFGIVSISTLVINFFNIFANLGFSNSIIYKQESNKKILSSLYVLNIALGAVIYLVINLATPLIVGWYNEPLLKRVIRTSSFYFLIIYFGQIHSFLFQKELKFKTGAIIEIVAVVVSTILTILLALKGFNEFSLIYGQLAGAIIRTVLNVTIGRKLFIPQLYFNYKEVIEHVKFGVYNVGDGLVGFVQGNLDNILLGHLLGIKLLGIYTIASQLAIFPIVKLNPIILQIAYPLLAKIKDNLAQLKQSYIYILDFVGYLNIPLLAGLYITSGSLVPIVYGKGWEDTIYIIKILSISSVFVALGHPLYTLVYSKGRPKLILYLNVVTLFVKAALLYFLGKYWGLPGIAVAILLTCIIALSMNFYIVHILIGNFFYDFLSNLLKPFLFSSLMIVAVRSYQLFTGTSDMLNAIVEVVIGGAVYALLTLKYKISFQEIKALRRPA